MSKCVQYRFRVDKQVDANRLLYKRLLTASVYCDMITLTNTKSTARDATNGKLLLNISEDSTDSDDWKLTMVSPTTTLQE